MNPPRFAALTWYLGGFLWPDGFRFERNLPVPLSWSDPVVVLGLGLLLTLGAIAVRALLRGRPAPLLFAAAGALAALGPVSQVLVPLKSLAAERFLYPALPSIVLGVWR